MLYIINTCTSSLKLIMRWYTRSQINYAAGPEKNQNSSDIHFSVVGNFQSLTKQTCTFQDWRSFFNIEIISEEHFHSRAPLALWWWYLRFPASHFPRNAKTDSLQVHFQHPICCPTAADPPIFIWLLPIKIWTDGHWNFSTSNN
jgi:hypothetical protein